MGTRKAVATFCAFWSTVRRVCVRVRRARTNRSVRHAAGGRFPVAPGMTEGDGEGAEGAREREALRAVVRARARMADWL